MLVSYFETISLIHYIILYLTTGSTPEESSSSSISLGSPAIALAKAKRRSIPPESCDAFRFTTADSDKPTFYRRFNTSCLQSLSFILNP